MLVQPRQVLGFRDRRQTVAGLESEAQTIEYRHGDNKSLYPIKMPAIRSLGDVTMRKGILAKDSTLLTWDNEIKPNTMTRRRVYEKLNHFAAALASVSMTAIFFTNSGVRR